MPGIRLFAPGRSRQIRLNAQRFAPAARASRFKPANNVDDFRCSSGLRPAHFRREISAVTAGDSHHILRASLSSALTKWPFEVCPPSTAILAILLPGVLLFASCSHPVNKTATRRDSQRIYIDIKSAIEEAGGQGVWVKSPVRDGSADSNNGNLTGEVLALTPRFLDVVAAIERRAEAEQLQTEIKSSRTKAGWRFASISLLQQRRPVVEWRVREVPKLLRVAIVIDDLGQDLEAARRLLHEPYPLTFSILPRLDHSAQTAREAHKAGRELMLHLPMQPESISGARPGPGGIVAGMGDDDVARTIEADLSSVPFVAGVNNHMGSRATANAALMAEVMKVLSRRRLYFIDSRTTAKSEALAQARRFGLPSFYRSVFLDDQETVAYTLGQCQVLRRTVEKQGDALAIGHPHPTTIKALQEFLPELERADIQLVPASQLVRLPEVSRLNPPASP